MRKFAFCICLAITSLTFAKTYYVATNGNDSNPGTFTQPWATWGKAFTSTLVNAGDTVFIRGGVYNITVTNGSGYGVTRSGTANDWIVYANYPGEIPILDCSAAIPSGQYNSGVGGSSRSGGNYVKFKGLTVRNVLQRRTDVMVWASGFGCENGNFKFENCTAYNIEGIGFESYFYDGWPEVDGYHYFINCDAYSCSNPEVISGYLPGNNGSGFSSSSFTSTKGHAYAINCRAWECGDQGFVMSGEHYCETTGCWSFGNGDLQGDGHGFKCGWHSLTYPVADRLNMVLTKCISAYNRYSGITTNDTQGVGTGMNIFNNLIYANGHYNEYIYGIYVYNTPDNSTNELLRIFRNNISFNNNGGEIYVASGAAYTHSNNSWDGGATITAADFIALPATQEEGIKLLSSPRQSDGSLPDLGNFFQLADNSDAIDAGINVGLPFDGNAPDLGPSDSKSGVTPPLEPAYVSSVVENANPSRLLMTYSLSLANIIPATSAFTVKVNSTARTVNTVTVSGTTVTLTLASPVSYGDQVTVAYTRPASNPLQTSQGAQAASLSAQNVTNNVAATLPAYVSSVVENADPSRLLMTYSLSLANIIPATSAFTVKVNSTARTVNTVTVSGTTVTLTLASPVSYGDQVTVAYTRPASNPLQTSQGAQAASLSAQNVTNNVASINQKPIVSISSPAKSTSFVAPATITIEASAYDPDGTIRKVEFFNGTQKLGEIFSAPYHFTWKNVPEGSFNLTAIAMDDKGAKTTSEPVTVVVEKSTTTINQMPVVNIFPYHKTFKYKKNSRIKIDVSAYDPDGYISHVAIKNGDVTLATFSAAPYTFTWEAADTGTFCFYAIAIDNQGAETLSPDLELIVMQDVEDNIIKGLYPNPTNGDLNIELSSNVDNVFGSYDISIVAPSGVTVYQERIPEEESSMHLNITHLPSTSYILVVSSGNKLLGTRKFIKY